MLSRSESQEIQVFPQEIITVKAEDFVPKPADYPFVYDLIKEETRNEHFWDVVGEFEVVLRGQTADFPISAPHLQRSQELLAKYQITPQVTDPTPSELASFNERLQATDETGKSLIDRLRAEFYEPYAADIDLSEAALLPRLTIEIQEYVTGITRLCNLVVDNQIETCVFLDRSARPAAHLFRKLWEQLYAGFDKPATVFINSGRENDGKIDDQDKIADLRNNYLPYVNGRRVAVVDETSVTGHTLYNTCRLLEATFPEINSLTGTVLFDIEPLWNQGDSGINTGLIGWYDEAEVEQRLDAPFNVGDSFTAKSYANVLKNQELDPNIKLFLTQRRDEANERSRRLRNDLAHLAAEIANKVTLHDPGPEPTKPHIPAEIRNWSGADAYDYLAKSN